MYIVYIHNIILPLYTCTTTVALAWMMQNSQTLFSLAFAIIVVRFSETIFKGTGKSCCKRGSKFEELCEVTFFLISKRSTTGRIC